MAGTDPQSGLVAPAQPSSCGKPTSALLVEPEAGVDRAFCAKWNPDFDFRGHRCCTKTRVPWKYRRRGIRCNPKRSLRPFCAEMTAEQMAYLKEVEDLKAHSSDVDLLKLIQGEIRHGRKQAYCETNKGFLAFGRPVIETKRNRIKLRRPARCVHFGTDHMVGMLEWVGQQIGRRYSDPEYSDLRLLVGDVSAPRGGCLTGSGGRRGHASHMNGQDVDLGFLKVEPNRVGTERFGREFRVAENWWLLKQVFNNPVACVKVVFLDRRHIRKLRKYASSDPDWDRLSPHIRHVRRHHDHFHIRVGDRVGPPGCGDPQQDVDSEHTLAELVTD